LSLDIGPLANAGAEVTGLDVSRSIPADIQGELYAAWLRHGVLVFRDVAHSDEEHLRLSHVFGPDSGCEYSDLVMPEQPELIRVSGEGKYRGPAFVINGRLSAGWLFWHQDEAYTTHVPQGSMLRMVTVPEEDGETGFLDIARAYEDLPEATRRRIDKLECIHRLKALPDDIYFGREGDFPGNVASVRMAKPEEFRVDKLTDGKDFPVNPTVHPLVLTRPNSNRKTMLLSPLGLCAVVGMGKTESDALLHELARHALQEKYMYIHRWRPDDCVLWDNFTAMHCGLGYPIEQHRLGFRTTIQGKLGSSYRTGRLYQPEPEFA
jgi:taurine dioxygenase